MKRKKILHIVEAFGGGVFTYIVNISNRLIADYDIVIAHALRPETPANYAEYFHPDITFRKVENFTREISPLQDLRAVNELKCISREFQPDIIHLHSSKAGVLGRLAFAWSHTPVFYTPHGYSFLMSDISPIKRRLYHAIEALCTLGGASTISCSPGEHRETLRMTSRAYLVNNGIDTDQLNAFLQDTEYKGTPFTVCTIGRICTQKNPELFSQIAARFPDISFLWIGDGELRSKLSAPNITITGWLDRSEAMSLIQKSDAFLLPSLWEGLPMSLLEAMYLCKPCIVSNVIGNRDVIQTGVNGFVCSSIEDYTAAVQTIRTGEIDPLVQQAHMDILTTYNTTVQVEGYKQVYQNALQRKEH